MKLFFRVFWRIMRHEKKALYTKACTSLLLACMWVIEPLFGRYAVDTFTNMDKSDTSGFAGIVGIWLLLYIITSIIAAYSMRSVWNVRNTVVARAREMYFEALLNMDIAKHIEAKSGELMKKIDNASDTISDMTHQLLIQLPTSSLTAVIFFGISLYISWQLTIISLLTIGLYVCILYLGNTSTKKNTVAVHTLWVNVLGRSYDAIANIFTVKSSGNEAYELENLHVNHEIGLQKLRQTSLVWALIEAIGFFMLLRIVLITAGMYFYIQGQMTLGSVFFYQFGFFRMIVPFDMVTAFMPKWNEMIHKIAMAEEIYLSTPSIETIPNAIQLPNTKGEIEFKDVSLKYKDQLVLQGISLHIHPGEHIALVGHSGAGKSSIALLINRFYDTTSGSITIDGTPITALDTTWWRRQIAMVQQENIMFNDTILANIAYSNLTASEADIVEASKKANAHDFIMQLPEQYNTPIGERGIRLSGGERQRIAIARAMLKNTKIVVLDEATSALDSITEQGVQLGIASLIENKTAIIIAHRLSTVRHVHKIAVIEQGQIIAFAGHDELMQTCSTYKDMVTLQQYGFLADSVSEKV